MENWIFCSRLCHLLRPRHQETLWMLRFLCLRFMHLYYKKCASSSKLTVQLSARVTAGRFVFQDWLTGFFFFFASFSLGGGTVGSFYFLEGRYGRSYCEFYFGFW